MILFELFLGVDVCSRVLVKVMLGMLVEVRVAIEMAEMSVGVGEKEADFSHLFRKGNPNPAITTRLIANRSTRLR